MATNYYKKHKGNLLKETREKYQNVSEEEKDKMGKMARDGYQNNLSKEEKRNKSVNIIVNVIRIFLRNKNKRKLIT